MKTFNQSLPYTIQQLQKLTPLRSHTQITQFLSILTPQILQETNPQLNEFYTQILSSVKNTNSDAQINQEVYKFIQILLQNSETFRQNSIKLDDFYLFLLFQSSQDIMLTASAVRIITPDLSQITNTQKYHILQLGKLGCYSGINFLIKNKQVSACFIFDYLTNFLAVLTACLIKNKHRHFLDILYEIKEVKESYSDIVEERILEGLIFPEVVRVLENLQEYQFADDFMSILEDPLQGKFVEIGEKGVESQIVNENEFKCGYDSLVKCAVQEKIQVRKSSVENALFVLSEVQNVLEIDVFELIQKEFDLDLIYGNSKILGQEGLIREKIEKFQCEVDLNELLEGYKNKYIPRYINGYCRIYCKNQDKLHQFYKIIGVVGLASDVQQLILDTCNEQEKAEVKEQLQILGEGRLFIGKRNSDKVKSYFYDVFDEVVL